ncbi:hypothetical protein [Streptomyces sp. NPDC048643]|uniref:hypothetical protein n=1 Tax=Streptomyces sp. NPDC048643 TaxID=3155637 RepID=UPI0034282A9E
MISDPEISGEFDTVESREVLGSVAESPARRHLSRRPWLWALGGTLAASAFWATAVFQYGLGDRKPDSHGYRLEQDPCPSMQLVSLGVAIAPRDVDALNDSGLMKHPDLDQVRCVIPLRQEKAGDAGSGASLIYAVGVTVALHKTADPSGEFEAGRRVTDLGVVAKENVKFVPDLGDRAYMITRNTDSIELRVRDGAAVFSLSLSATRYYDSGSAADEADDESDLPDLSTYQPALTNDMRDLMSLPNLHG